MTFKEGKEEYYQGTRKKVLFTTLCVIGVVAAFMISLTIGFYDLTVVECYQIIINHITGNIEDVMGDDIVWNTRLPISLYAIICGATLAVGGAIMQTILRNPLADPYTMGISSGASLGASLSIILGLSLWSGFSDDLSLVTMAFVFSLIPVGVILFFSIVRKTTPSKIILIGIAVMYMFSAITSLLMVTASEESLAEIYAWNIGSLATITWPDVPLPLIVSTLCIIFLYSQSRSINVMMSGENTSRSLGINTRRMTMICMVVISMMTAVVVCFCGTIGFVGLVGPHIARVFVGSETRYLLPASAAFGALFLLVANCIAMVAGTFGLPVGVVSSLIGCPLFIFLLLKMRRKAWK